MKQYYEIKKLYFELYFEIMKLYLEIVYPVTLYFNDYFIAHFIVHTRKRRACRELYTKETEPLNAFLTVSPVKFVNAPNGCKSVGLIGT